MSGPRRGKPAPLIWSHPPPPPRQRTLDHETIVNAATETAADGGLPALVEQGMPVTTARSYAALIDRHVFGNGLQAVEEDQMRERYGLDTAEEFLAAIASVRELATADGGYPHLAAWLAEPTGPTID